MSWNNPNVLKVLLTRLGIIFEKESPEKDEDLLITFCHSKYSKEIHSYPYFINSWINRICYSFTALTFSNEKKNRSNSLKRKSLQKCRTWLGEKGQRAGGSLPLLRSLQKGKLRDSVNAERTWRHGNAHHSNATTCALYICFQLG